MLKQSHPDVCEGIPTIASKVYFLPIEEMFMVPVESRSEIEEFDLYGNVPISDCVMKVVSVVASNFYDRSLGSCRIGIDRMCPWSWPKWRCSSI